MNSTTLDNMSLEAYYRITREPSFTGDVPLRKLDDGTFELTTLTLKQSLYVEKLISMSKFEAEISSIYIGYFDHIPKNIPKLQQLKSLTFDDSENQFNDSVFELLPYFINIINSLKFLKNLSLNIASRGRFRSKFFNMYKAFKLDLSEHSLLETLELNGYYNFKINIIYPKSSKLKKLEIGYFDVTQWNIDIILNTINNLEALTLILDNQFTPDELDKFEKKISIEILEMNPNIDLKIIKI